MSSTVRVLPTELATGARDVFADLVRTHAGEGPTSDRFFVRDHRSLWRELVAGGWHCVGLPEDHGGYGFDLLDLTTFAEVWGSNLIPLPYVPTLLLLRWSGVTADHAPTEMLTYSLTRTAASPGEVGVAPFLSAPGTAPVVRLANGSLETAAAGPAPQVVVADHEPGGTPSMPLACAPFVTEGLPPDAYQEIAVLGAAELVGAAATVLEKSVAYSRQRQQFGRPIKDYQAVQHRLADMLCDLEVARSAVVRAANDPVGWKGPIAVAWDLTLRVTDNGIRIHGGFGMTWDAGLHQFVRHVTAWGDLFESCGVDLWHR